MKDFKEDVGAFGVLLAAGGLLLAIVFTFECFASAKDSCFLVEGSNFSMNLKRKHEQTKLHQSDLTVARLTVAP